MGNKNSAPSKSLQNKIKSNSHNGHKNSALPQSIATSSKDVQSHICVEVLISPETDYVFVDEENSPSKSKASSSSIISSTENGSDNPLSTSLIMTPSSSNNNTGDGADIDRISDLPRNVIDTILSKLPIKVLVRTSILSSQWRYTWKTARALEFDLDFYRNYKLSYDYKRFEICYDPQISHIINKVLLAHHVPIHKFTLHILPFNFKSKIKCFISEWVQFLSACGIRDLQLLNSSVYGLEMPCQIFSCQDLRRLIFSGFKLSIPPNFFGFENLLRLHLFDVIVTTGALENLILSCPCLEELRLHQCSGFQCVNIFAPSLRVFEIEHDSEVKPICLKNAENLTDLTLFGDKLKEKVERCRVFDLIKGLPKVERLLLGEGYIKMFSAESISHHNLRRSINSLKYLKLNGVNFNETEELQLIIWLLESSPNLVELTIKSDSIALDQHGGYLNEIYCSNCCLNRLKTVNISVETAYENPLTLIRFVLANASSLETLTFKVGLDDLEESGSPSLLLSIKTELMQMKPASLRAKVKFLYYSVIT